MTTENLFTREGEPAKQNAHYYPRANSTGSGYPGRRIQLKCTRCGGVGGSDKWLHTGWKCFDCNGSGLGRITTVRLYTQAELDKLNVAAAGRAAKKETAREAAAAAEQVRRVQEREAVAAASAETISLIRSIPADKRPEFFADVIAQVEERAKPLTDKQVAAVTLVAEKTLAEIARREKAAHVGTVGERVDMTLTLQRVIVLGDGYSFGSVVQLAVFRDDSGNTITYKGESFRALELDVTWDYSTGRGVAEYTVPQTLRVKATVKDHYTGKRDGEPQTAISRPKRIKE